MKNLLLFLILIICLPFQAFSNAWEEISDFPFQTDGSFSFVIDEKVYVSGGSLNNYFYTYEKKIQQWKRLADVPSNGEHLRWAFSFVIDGKGYIAGGSFDKATDLSNKVFMYDPAANKWTEKKSLPFARDAGFSFSLNGKGYIGGGFDGENLNSDLWEYDTNKDSWTQVSNYPGGTVLFPTYFTIKYNGKEKAYIGLGDNGISGAAENDQFWEYDNLNNTWKQVANFIGAPRWTAIGFSIDDMGFVGGGMSQSSTNLKDFWRYDSKNDKWLYLEDFDLPNEFTTWSTGFILDKNIYFGLGVQFPEFNYTKKFYKRDFSVMTSIRNKEKINNQNYISSWVNDDVLNLNINNFENNQMNLSCYSIYNLNGSLLDSDKIQSCNLNDLNIKISHLDKGIYFILFNINGNPYFSNFYK